jgi:hypothetical protein
MSQTLLEELCHVIVENSLLELAEGVVMSNDRATLEKP